MPKLKNNRLNTLNNKGFVNNNFESLTAYKKKLLESRKGKFTDILNRYRKDLPEQEQNNKFINVNLTVSKTNYINCPECNDLIDIKQALEDELQTVQCKTCRTNNIELAIQLKKQNKLDLLKSGGIPTGELFHLTEVKAKDLLLRPTQHKKLYETDTDTGLKIRKVDTSTMNNTRIRSKYGMNKDFIDEYNNYMTKEQQESYKPINNLIHKPGIKITNIIDIT